MSRWDRLFADLAAQAEAAEAAEFASDVDERTRLEVGANRLIDRLRAATGRPIRLGCVGGESVAGVVKDVGVDWLLLSERADQDALVAVRAVTNVSGLGPASAPPARASPVADRLNFRYALRGLARDRLGVRISLADATAIAGTIDRVGADFIDVAEHPVGEARRSGAVRQVRAVPIDAVGVVRSGR